MQGDEARWRSGYAEDCKSLHAGSIPARASIISRFMPGWNAALAQLVEHIIRNDGVTCSSHVSGTIRFSLLLFPARFALPLGGAREDSDPISSNCTRYIDFNVS